MAMSEAQRTAHDIAANQAMPWGKIDGRLEALQERRG